jgi:endonuclease-3
MDKKRSAEIISLLRSRYGDAKPALEYRTLYELCIAVVLSAQTTDKQVNTVTPLLFSRYPDFASLALANVSDLEKIIHSTGFYKNKASNISKLAKKVVSDFEGKLPGRRDQLESLPGVGRKTTNVILSQGFGIPALAVDTHVGRLCLLFTEEPSVWRKIPTAAAAPLKSSARQRTPAVDIPAMEP